MFGFEWTCVSCGIPHNPPLLLCIRCHSQVNWIAGQLPSLADQIRYEFPVENIYVGAIFQRNSPIQKVLKAIKYRGRKDLAFKAGRLLKQDFNLAKHSILIPVPLHNRKKFIRGYNQAACFAKGLTSHSQNIQIKHLLKRNKHAKSLTTQNRLLRSQQDCQYQLISHQLISKPHFIVVDDVFTTGATALQCLLALHSEYRETASYSIAVLAYADDL